MLASYARAYGGPPAADSPWPLFLTLAAKAEQLDARDQLRFYDAVTGAIGAAFGGGSASKTERDLLVRRAYDVADRPLVFHENRFAPDYGDPADA